MRIDWSVILYVAGVAVLFYAMNPGLDIKLYDRSDALHRSILTGLLLYFTRKNPVHLFVFSMGLMWELWNLKDELTGNATEIGTNEAMFFVISLIIIDVNIWHWHRCSYKSRRSTF